MFIFLSSCLTKVDYYMTAEIELTDSEESKYEHLIGSELMETFNYFVMFRGEVEKEEYLKIKDKDSIYKFTKCIDESFREKWLEKKLFNELFKNAKKDLVDVEIYKREIVYLGYFNPRTFCYFLFGKVPEKLEKK